MVNIILFFLPSQHTTAINQISIDQSGDYVASCSDDGRVSTDGTLLFFVYYYSQEHLFEVNNTTCIAE